MTFYGIRWGRGGGVCPITSNFPDVKKLIVLCLLCSFFI